VSRELPSEVAVELDAAELGGPVRVGGLRRVSSASGAVVAFAYDTAWLARSDAFVIYPTHGLYPGDQFPRAGDAIAAAFTDAAPDRWGRTLLERREAGRAREEGRTRRTLGEWEFLLGVSDFSRMGALRFADAAGRYLDDEAPGVPPQAGLRELEAAARALEHPSRGDRSREAEWLALLLAPGSSLGGSRPKATFSGNDGALWIAKFPSRTDRHDVGACELVLNDLAARAGIEVPEHRLLALGEGHRTFAARRFDRLAGSRRAYASAMTMTSRRDRDAASYLDIALAIADHGAPRWIRSDLAQLFRRAAFNVLASHRDDHLRNHGFLRTSDGWRLAPAFDLNPVPGKPQHELSLDGAIHRGDLEILRETAAFYRLSGLEAEVNINEVRAALGAWRDVVHGLNLGAEEIDVLEDAIAV
jgi:serine/threonine-protein kinase HipA